MSDSAPSSLNPDNASGDIMLQEQTNLSAAYLDMKEANAVNTSLREDVKAALASTMESLERLKATRLAASGIKGESLVEDSGFKDSVDTAVTSHPTGKNISQRENHVHNANFKISSNLKDVDYLRKGRTKEVVGGRGRVKSERATASHRVCGSVKGTHNIEPPHQVYVEVKHQEFDFDTDDPSCYESHFDIDEIHEERKSHIDDYESSEGSEFYATGYPKHYSEQPRRRYSKKCIPSHNRENRRHRREPSRSQKRYQSHCYDSVQIGSTGECERMEEYCSRRPHLSNQRQRCEATDSEDDYFNLSNQYEKQQTCYRPTHREAHKDGHQYETKNCLRKPMSPGHATQKNVVYISDFGKRFGPSLDDVYKNIKGQNRPEKSSCVRRQTPKISEKSSSVRCYSGVKEYTVNPLRQANGRPTNSDANHQKYSTSLNISVSKRDVNDVPMQETPSDFKNTLNTSQEQIGQLVTSSAGKAEILQKELEVEELRQENKRLVNTCSRKESEKQQYCLEMESKFAGLKVVHQREMNALIEKQARQQAQAKEDTIKEIDSKWEKELEKENEKTRNAKAAYTEITQRFSRFKKEYTSLKEKCTSLEESASRHIKDVGFQGKKNDELTRQMRGLKEMMKKYEEQLLSKDQEKQIVVQKLAVSDSRVSELELKVHNLTRSNTEFEQHANEELKKITALVDSSRESYEGRLLEFDTVNKKYERLKIKFKELQEKENKLQQDEIPRRDKQIQDLKTAMECAQLEEEHRIQSLQKDLEITEERIQDTRREHDRDKTEWSDQVNSAWEKCNILDIALQHCKRELENSQRTNYDLKEEIDRITTELAESKRVAVLRDEEQKGHFDAYRIHTAETIKALKGAIKEKEQEMHKLIGSSNGANESVVKLRHQLAAVRGRCATLERQLDDVRGLAKHVSDNLQKEIHRGTTFSKNILPIMSSGSTTSIIETAQRLSSMPLGKIQHDEFPIINEPSTVPPVTLPKRAMPTELVNAVMTLNEISGLGHIHDNISHMDSIAPSKGYDYPLIHQSEDYDAKIGAFSKSTEGIYKKLIRDDTFRAQCTSLVRNMTLEAPLDTSSSTS